MDQGFTLKKKFYLKLLALFFRNAELAYRCVVATGKKQLDHEYK